MKVFIVHDTNFGEIDSVFANEVEAEARRYAKDQEPKAMRYWWTVEEWEVQGAEMIKTINPTG